MSMLERIQLFSSPCKHKGRLGLGGRVGLPIRSRVSVSRLDLALSFLPSEGLNPFENNGTIPDPQSICYYAEYPLASIVAKTQQDLLEGSMNVPRKSSSVRRTMRLLMITCFVFRKKRCRS